MLLNELFLLLRCFAFDGPLLGLLVQRSQLTLLPEDFQQLDDEWKVVVLAPDVLDLKMNKNC